MVKLRKIASIERGIEEILQILTKEEIKETIQKGASYLRKCSDPDRDLEGKDSEGVKRNIDHIESVKLDKKCVQKGISPPLLTAHQFIIDQEKSNNQSNMENEVLVTGGAGFIGSHVVEQLTARGNVVRVVDDLSTGKIENLAAVKDHPKLSFHRVDVADPPSGGRGGLFVHRQLGNDRFWSDQARTAAAGGAAARGELRDELLVRPVGVDLDEDVVL